MASKVSVQLRNDPYLICVFGYHTHVRLSSGFLFVFVWKLCEHLWQRNIAEKMLSEAHDIIDPSQVSNDYPVSPSTPVRFSTPQGPGTPPTTGLGSPTVAQLTATRSPTVLTGKSRKRQRLDNFFKGKARLAYSLPPKLESSLTDESESSFATVQATDRIQERCKHGCTEILGHLSDVFHAIGRHNAKKEEINAKSYPKEGNYKNMTGRFILTRIEVATLCVHHSQAHVHVNVHTCVFTNACVHTYV